MEERMTECQAAGSSDDPTARAVGGAPTKVKPKEGPRAAKAPVGKGLSASGKPQQGAKKPALS